MKKTITKTTLLSVFILLSYAGQSQYVWKQKANFPGNARAWGSCFSIGHYGYVGCGQDGSNTYSDWWRYDQHTNTWSAIASYPGNGSLGCTCFSIGGKGYVGLGLKSGNV